MAYAFLRLSGSAFDCLGKYYTRSASNGSPGRRGKPLPYITNQPEARTFEEYAARNRGEDFDRLKYATEETFELSPLPCWAHLSPEVYRERVAALVEEIEREAARLRRSTPQPKAMRRDCGKCMLEPLLEPLLSLSAPTPLGLLVTLGRSPGSAQVVLPQSYLCPTDQFVA